jgi:hypothetical protein
MDLGDPESPYEIPNLSWHTLMNHLQPQQWLSPATATWDDWDILINSNDINQQVAV